MTNGRAIMVSYPPQQPAFNVNNSLPLLPRKSLETNSGLQLKLNVPGFQTICEFVELFPFKDNTKVRDGDFVAWLVVTSSKKIKGIHDER
jgi:hypothetical protein